MDFDLNPRFNSRTHDTLQCLPPHTHTYTRTYARMAHCKAIGGREETRIAPRPPLLVCAPLREWTRAALRFVTGPSQWWPLSPSPTTKDEGSTQRPFTIAAFALNGTLSHRACTLYDTYARSFSQMISIE
jgi:hypothetical protein